ncbi:MAG: hypothetical protein ACI97A_001153 [Planctomycetota bacterium]
MENGVSFIDKLFGRDEIGVRVGRQEIVWGNELHFGDNSFYGGKSFDATLLWWGQKEWSPTLVWAKFDTGNAYNAAGHPYSSHLSGGGFDDDEAYAAFFTLNTIENHVLDLYDFFVNANGSGGTSTTLGFGVPADTFAHVFGNRFSGDLTDVAACLDYNIEFAYETGDINGTNLELEGMIIEDEIGLTFNAESKFTKFGRFIFSEGGDTNETGFVPLFVDRHEQVNWDAHTNTRARWGIVDIKPMTNVLAGQISMTFMPSKDYSWASQF